MRRWLTPLMLAGWLAPIVALADYLRVSRPATVKEEPRGDAVIIRHASEGDTFELASTSQSNGYYEVRLSPGSPQTGWIYRTLVRRFAGPLPGGGGGPAPTPGGTPVSTGGMLEVHVIDVGQGDAVLIRCPDGTHEMLIDSGELNFRYPRSATRFQAYMVAHQAADNPIEVALSTHPHSDHIGSMAWVLNQYPVVLYVDDQNQSTSGTYQDVEAALQAAQGRGTRYWGAQELQIPDIDFCPRNDVTARILRPAGYGHDTDPNNNSVVVRVDYGSRSFLFVGDAEREEEDLLLADPTTAALLDCDFLKVGHHASETSSTTNFLNAVTPTIAAVSCGLREVGSNHNHKHPRTSTLQALLPFLGVRPGAAVVVQAFNGVTRVWEPHTVTVNLYVTAAEGNLVFESDGQTIRRR